ncbi:hypothetical protein AKJ16_DCAP23337 [Drosera capensis]
MMMAPFCPLSIDANTTTCRASSFLGFGIAGRRTPPPTSSSRSPISFSLSSSSTPSESHICSHVNSCKFTGVNKNSKYRKFGYYTMSTTFCDFTMSKSIAGGDNHPDHLLVLVHASSSNAYTKTFDGIDASGRRLAEEACCWDIISARNMNAYEGDDPSKTDGFQRSGTIAGLEPINIITLATPHLGAEEGSSVEYCPPVSWEGPHYSLKAAKAKEAAQSSPSIQNTVEYHEIVEEEMISGLQRLEWKKVDVSFHSAVWQHSCIGRFYILVVFFLLLVVNPHLISDSTLTWLLFDFLLKMKNEWFHNAGFGVVAHVADSLKQQESCLFVSSSL